MSEDHQQAASGFIPGFQFRTMDNIGVNKVIGANQGTLYYRAPDGAVVPLDEKRGGIIPEPKLRPREVSYRVWLLNQKRMIIDVCGLIKRGSGWINDDDEQKYYEIHTFNETPLRVKSCNVIITYDTGFFSIGDTHTKVEALFELDIVSDSQNHNFIIFWEEDQYVCRFLDQNRSFPLTNYRFRKVGDVLSDSNYYDLYVKSAAKWK